MQTELINKITNEQKDKALVIVLVLRLNFEQFFFDLLASVGLGNKNGCKDQH